MIQDDMHTILTSGKMFYTNGDRLGLGKDLAISYGADGSLSAEDLASLTAAERAEIADMMILRWQQWKEHGTP